MTDLEESDRSVPRTWTVKYRLPLAALSGLLAGLCVWLLFSDSAVQMWIGGVGLAVLIAWAVLFTVLYRRGY